MTTLNELINEQHWDGVRDQLQTPKGLEEAKEPDEDGFFPLHGVLMAQCWHSDVLETLIRAYPEALNKRNRSGGFPLHQAIEYSYGCLLPSVIMLMIELAPDVLQEVNMQRSLPLHLLVIWWEGDSFMELFELMYEAYPEATQTCPLGHETYLHTVCTRGKEKVDHVLLFLLHRNPDIFREKCGTQLGLYPIHLACANKHVSRKVLEQIHEYFPEAIQYSGEQFRMNAFEWVLRERKDRFSDHGARFVLDKFPAVVSAKSFSGKLPLHLVCQCLDTVSDELALAVLEAYPEAACEPDLEGHLPYHYLCQSMANEEDGAFAAALKQASGPVEKDQYGMWPLHHIAKGAEESLNLDFALSILNAKPQIAREKDVMGKLPFHYICENINQENASFALALLKIYPEAAGEAYVNHGYGCESSILPLERCLWKRDMPLEFGLALLNAYPDALRAKDSEGSLPIHQVCREEELVSGKFGAAVLDTYPDAAKEKDRRSRLPLHLVCEHARNMPIEFLATLLVVYPDAAKERDSRGMLPLHCLCQNAQATNASAAVSQLLEVHPEAAQEPDKYGRLPYHHIPQTRNGDDEDSDREEASHLGDDDTYVVVPKDFSEKILAAHPAAAVQRKLDPKDAIKYLENEYGMPCFTWKLGPPSDGDDVLDDIMTDRVGGNSGFATYPEQAAEWPCDQDSFFVCQVNLGNIPKKMESLIGNDGLLQIFQATDEGWFDCSFVRVIPSKDFTKLVPCTALPQRSNDYNVDPQSCAPRVFPIVGWEEHMDFPSVGSDEYDNALHVLGLNRDTAKHVWGNKFGGYGSYVQGGGGLEDCSHCGQCHQTEIQFQLIDDFYSKGHPDGEALKCVPVGDAGTVQYYWCPTGDTEKTLSTGGACC